MSAYRTSVDQLNLYSADGDRSLHYERDHDLFVQAKSISRGGDVAALLAVELGIDGAEAHRVRLDFGTLAPDDDTFTYSPTGDEVRALTDAIDALTTLRDRLAAMASA